MFVILWSRLGLGVGFGCTKERKMNGRPHKNSNIDMCACDEINKIGPIV